MESGTAFNDYVGWESAGGRSISMLSFSSRGCRWSTQKISFEVFVGITVPLHPPRLVHKLFSLPTSESMIGSSCLQKFQPRRQEPTSRISRHWFFPMSSYNPWGRRGIKQPHVSEICLSRVTRTHQVSYPGSSDASACVLASIFILMLNMIGFSVQLRFPMGMRCM